MGSDCISSDHCLSFYFTMTFLRVARYLYDNTRVVVWMCRKSCLLVLYEVWRVYYYISPRVVTPSIRQCPSCLRVLYECGRAINKSPIFAQHSVSTQKLPEELRLKLQYSNFWPHLRTSMPPKKKGKHQTFPEITTSPKNPWADPNSSWGSPPPLSLLEKLDEVEV